ncbi:HAD-like protein [Gloeophyllum trabeum ATCC 11539]|uniref:HAD-like protein n=1 Tax=Gloeophyllum trabeum (strain ATCC 11539 / FP-39264 / Madison 617) TaxID=670483 RepID=S7RD53_GLOTA|nr:HAD-like protein [Gloeophyllum trabeum ATCC 11539]EPQ52135.1 HAD-like protein [Gloeophyllum trabeum ATCC 11539]
MAEPKLTQFKALLFDVYGTLVDWETGIYDRLKPLLERANKPWSKKEALTAFYSVERDLQAQNPGMLYADLLAKGHAEFESRLKGGGSAAPAVTTESDPSTSASGSRSGDGSADEDAEHIAFGQSIKDWPIFPDTIPALSMLSETYKLVVLSNVDRTSFAHTRAALEGPGHFTFDLVITAQDVGSYKPSLANFEYALKEIKEKFGIDKDGVLVVANSLAHDHVPANALGIASCWIERPGATMGQDAKARHVFDFKTLGDMADAVAKEKAKS